MKALILAAGKGKRLWPITEDIPKAMVEIGGKPVLERIILQLKPWIKDFVIVVGYQKENIINHFGNGKKFGVSITYVEQKELLGTGHAVLQAESILKNEKEFLLVLGDTYFDEKIIPEIINTDAEGILGVVHVDNPSRFGIVETDKTGRIINFIEKPSNPPTNLAVLGIYRLPREIFKALHEIKLSPRGEYEIVDAIRNLLSKMIWKTVTITAKDIGTLADLEQARNLEK